MQEKFSEIVKFIRETFHTPEAFIPLHEPRFIGNEKKYINECIDSTFVSSVGKFVDRFEIEIAKYTGAKKAVVCVNGTNALHLALMLAGVERDDEVITQPLTFIATANAISYCNAHPVFIDVDKDTFGLSPQSLESWLQENVEMCTPKPEARSQKPEARNKLTNRRISACVPMHTFGHPCRIDEIASICEKYNIPVVEDAAESLGSFYSPRVISLENKKGIDKTIITRGKGQHTGTFGKIGVLSFNGNKIITTGGGGMLLFNDVELANKAKHLTTQAKVPHQWEFIHDDIGYNYRMPNINAALGVAQLEQLPAFLHAKRKLTEAYSSFFSSFASASASASASSSNLTFFTEPEHAKSNYWLNGVILENRKQRDEFLSYTNKDGIMTRPVWELMNRLPMFKDAQCGDLSNAEWIADRLVNIPSSVNL